jgi:hypothetical protein
MRNTTTVILAFAALASLAACQEPPRDASAISEERRVWVVRRAMRKDTEVYRCADGAGPDQPPKPVCVRAPMKHEPGGED